MLCCPTQATQLSIYGCAYSIMCISFCPRLRSFHSRGILEQQNRSLYLLVLLEVCFWFFNTSFPEFKFWCRAALEAFKCRILYANVSNDCIQLLNFQLKQVFLFPVPIFFNIILDVVGWRTSSIRRKLELSKVIVFLPAPSSISSCHRF